MIIALSLLYPANYYITYGNSSITLLFSIGFAMFAGYIYLLINSIYKIITKKITLTFDYIKKSTINFIKSYLSVMAYIAFTNCILIMFNKYDVFINIWVTRFICIAVACCVGKFTFLKKKHCVLFVVLSTLALSIFNQATPISLYIESYILITLLLICQITIKTSIYETIHINQLRQGMILSTMSSIPMQLSITKGLPSISTEDLRSRLSLDEIDKIKIWAKATHVEELTIVRKIPFAVFISIGFLSYFVLWGIIYAFKI